jgi:guanylate kinase
MYPESVTIFIDVPYEELVRRLKNRNTETQEQIEKRASRIKMEVELKDRFDHIVDNSKGLQTAVLEIEKIIKNKI